MLGHLVMGEEQAELAHDLLIFRLLDLQRERVALRRRRRRRPRLRDAAQPDHCGDGAERKAHTTTARQAG
eukprot:6454908-Prymnesium_polylepis.1